VATVSPRRGTRDDTGEHYTYIRDPDGNLIELVYHPLGLADADGNTVEVTTHPRGIRWRQLPEVEAALLPRTSVKTSSGAEAG
jgi:catechol 2,3-dioxygenase-like lactoylglutathione lyase family enzyme